MGVGFGKHSSVLRRRNDREKLLFITAAGLAFSLLVIMLVVISNRPADANQAQQIPVQAQIAPAMATVTLYTPEREIRPGTRLSPDRFKEVFWPRNQVPEGAVRELSELRDQYAKAILQPGVPVQLNQLSPEPVEDALPLTPGNRAISIEIDQVSGLEGHALPGTKVDITLTFMQDQNLTTKILVQNARVLSYGGYTKTAYEGSPRLEKSILPGKTITLDVTPQDALKIQTARQMGRLGLIMRTLDDDKTAVVTEYSNSDVAGNKQDRKNDQRNCVKGRVTVAGKEMIVGCDGQISQVINPAAEVAQ